MDLNIYFRLLRLYKEVFCSADIAIDLLLYNLFLELLSIPINSEGVVDLIRGCDIIII